MGRKFKEYFIEKQWVKVFYKSYGNDFTEVVNIILPGWSTNELSFVLEELAVSYFEHSKNTAVTLCVELEDYKENIEVEIEALVMFINEMSINAFYLIGYSQGGTKALYLSRILNEKQKRLILIAPTSLYNINPIRFIFDFLLEVLILINLYAIKEVIKTKSLKPINVYLGAGMEVIKNIPRVVYKLKLRSIYKYIYDIKYMSMKAPEIDLIICPIILILGIEDMISQTKKIMSLKVGEEIIKRILESKDELVLIPEEETYLQKRIFNSSKKIIFLSPKRAAHHLLPIFYAEYVAKISTEYTQTL